MFNVKAGDIKKYTFGTFVVDKSIKTTNFKFVESATDKTEICPRCNYKFMRTVEHNIVEVFVLKGVEESEGSNAYVGTTKKGKVLKLPTKKTKELLIQQGVL